MHAADTLAIYVEALRITHQLCAHVMLILKYKAVGKKPDCQWPGDLLQVQHEEWWYSCGAYPSTSHLVAFHYSGTCIRTWRKSVSCSTFLVSRCRSQRWVPRLQSVHFASFSLAAGSVSRPNCTLMGGLYLWRLLHISHMYWMMSILSKAKKKRKIFMCLYDVLMRKGQILQRWQH